MEPSGLLSQPVRLAGTRLLRLQSDDRLVELVRAGHEPAFDAIVHRYRPALLRYCTRILGPERAEDAVQQALASAHTAMSNGDDDRHLQLRPWLYRIAHNTGLNFLRGSRREEVQLDDAAFAAAHTPEDQVAERERLESVLQAIAALPRSQRDALLLRELEGRSHEEIGRALGVSSGAARATLFRARAAVRTACSALTPTPLLLRVAEIGAADGGSSHVAAKAVAGVLAGCVLVGGGASTGVIGGTHHPQAPEQAQAAAPERAAQSTRTTPAVAVTTAAAPAVATTTAPKAAEASAAREPAERPKPLKAPKPVKMPRPKPEPKPRPAPAPAPAPAAVPPAEDHGRRDGWRVEDAERPEVDRRPEHGRGRGPRPETPAAVPQAPAAPVEDDRGHGHAYGRDKDHGGKGDDQAIEGVSGSRESAASMSASENSGSSKDPDR
jgi:RNA polymerase sigma factor (sigma-70 family)